MPTLTVSLTTPQEQQAREAFLFLNEDATNATNDQITDWLKKQIRDKVRIHKIAKANQSLDANAGAELASEGW